jgi:hypothetical protein
MAVDPIHCPDCQRFHSPLIACYQHRFYDPLAYYEANTSNEGWDLIRDMVGLDKGPDEEEYVEWNERAVAFLKKHGKL